MADPQPAEPPANGAPAPETLAPAPAPASVPVPAPAAAAAAGLAAKRQRRPSVRLGDIGEQPAAVPHDPFLRRTKQWRVPSHHSHPPPLSFPLKEPSSAPGGWAGKISSRTRPLTNLAPDDGDDAPEIPVVAEDKGFHPGEENLEAAGGVRRGGRDGRAKRGGTARRVRTNWMLKADEGMDAADLKSSGEDAGDEGYRDYDDLRMEDSESPMKEHSPSDKRAVRVRVSESREACAATTAEATDVDTQLERESRAWNRGHCHPAVDGRVRAWLNGLGLGKYALVFQIHEVDEEVLPLLTLEDLKDMGIYAVGSRRKMYSAIQKLRKSFS